MRYVLFESELLVILMTRRVGCGKREERWRIENFEWWRGEERRDTVLVNVWRACGRVRIGLWTCGRLCIRNSDSRAKMVGVLGVYNMSIYRPNRRVDL